MKMTKIMLAGAVSTDVLTGLDANDDLPLFAHSSAAGVHLGAEGAAAVDDVVVAVDVDIDAGAVVASFEDVDGADLEQAGRDDDEIAAPMRTAEIERRLATARTPERQRLLEMMRTLDERDGLLPRCGNKYHLRGVLALAEVSFNDWMSQSALRDDVARLAPLFRLGDSQATAHVRGGPKLDSIIGLARQVMDELEADGIAIMRESRKSYNPSRKWFSDRMGVPRSTTSGMSLLWEELRVRVNQGRLKIGEPFIDAGAPSRAAVRAAMAVMRRVFDECLRTGRPIPASSERSNRIDIDWLLDEAHVFDRRMRETLKCNQLFRRDLAELIRKVRMKPVHLSRLDPRAVPYERLETEGEPLLRQAYRADTPKAEAGSVLEDRWVANQISFLRRFRKVNERDPSDDAAADFGSAAFDEMRTACHTASVKGNQAFDQSIDGWKGHARALLGATAFPASFAGAVDAGMVAAGRTAPSVAAALGCKKQVIHAWRQGVTTPTFQNVHLVKQLEIELGMVPGTLMQRLPKIRNSRTMYGGRKDIEMDDGKVVHLSGLWRYMDADSPTWPVERLRVHVEETLKRVYGAETAHRVRQRAAMNNAYGLPDPDPTSPIWAELEDLVGFQSGLIDDGRLRHPKSEWRSDGTIKVHRGQTAIFARWLMMATEKGGAGIAPGLISFSLLLNHRLVLRYIAWRVLRAEHLEIDGEAIGPKITATEKGLLAFFGMLLDPMFGWITQSRHVVQAPVLIDAKFRMPFIRAAKDGIHVINDDTCPWHPIMPADIVEAASTVAGWKAAATESCAHIRSTQSRFAQSFKLIRNPQLLVMPFLKHQNPIAVGLRMVRQALEHARPIGTSAHLHALDYQRAVAFLLLMLVVFRSGTMRELTWKVDGTGNVRRLRGGYEVVVGADSFKNGFSSELFGPSWNRRDYERTLGDWGGLNEVLDHYLEKCRPILLAGRQSDLLFPPPRGRTDWTEHNFNYLVTSFTRKWCVYNPRYKTGLHGVAAFGPHPSRNIVATHIIRNHPNEDRWRLASIVLGTSISKVKLNYGWITTREELAKTDYLFKDASDLAAGEFPLW